MGSFHEYHDVTLNSRRYSSSVNDGNMRTSTIDENSSYDDLLKV
jgi:hypothetical protein